MNEATKDPSFAEPQPSLGHRLSKARKTRGWTLGYCASQLHLPESTVELLESDLYSELPADVYVKGYLRNYARLLRLSPEEIVQAYVEQQSTTCSASDITPRRRPGTTPPPPPLLTRSRGEQTRRASSGYQEVPRPRSGSSAWLWVAVVFGFAYASTWWWPEDGLRFQDLVKDFRTTPEPAEPAEDRLLGREADQAEPPKPEESSAPVEALTAPLAPSGEAAPAPEAVAGSSTAMVPTPEEPSPTGDTLVLRFNGDSWATVVDAEGKQLLYQTGIAGTQKVIQGKAPFKLTLGRVANVAIELNGQSVVYPNAKNRATVRFNVPLKPSP